MSATRKLAFSAVRQPRGRLDERLGPEIIAEPYPVPYGYGGSTAWDAVTAGCGMAYSTTDCPPNYGHYTRVTSVDGAYDRLQTISFMTGSFVVGHTYRVQALARGSGASGVEQGLYGFGFTDGTEEVPLQGTGWQMLSVDVVATLNNGKPRLYANRFTGSTSDYVDCAYLSIREVQ